MRGNPIIDSAILLALLALLAVPIVRLTGTDQPAEVNVHGEHIHVHDEEMISAWLEIKSSQAPEALSIVMDGKTIWSIQENADEEIEWGDDVELHLEDHACILHLEGRWPEGQDRIAVEITVEPDGLPASSSIHWTGNTLDDIAEFRWE